MKRRLQTRHHYLKYKPYVSQQIYLKWTLPPSVTEYEYLSVITCEFGTFFWESVSSFILWLTSEDLRNGLLIFADLLHKQKSHEARQASEIGFWEVVLTGQEGPKSLKKAQKFILTKNLPIHIWIFYLNMKELIVLSSNFSWKSDIEFLSHGPKTLRQIRM